MLQPNAKGPVYIRLGRPKVPIIFDENYKFEIGKGIVVKEGTDVALIATGIMVGEALKAAEQLQNQGVKAAVVNISTIKPIDIETITQIAQTTRAVVTCEEHNIYGV